MQHHKSTSNLIHQNDEYSAFGRDHSTIYKIVKTIFISLSFMIMGLYVEIIGPTLPDLKLQLGIYKLYKNIGLVLTLESLAVIVGCLLFACLYLFCTFQFKWITCGRNDCKINLLISVSFFLATAGTLLIPFTKSNGFSVLYLAFPLIGMAQGMLLIGGTIMLFHLWSRNGILLFTNKFHFFICALYALGALLASVLVRCLLVPLIFEYFEHYEIIEEPTKLNEIYDIGEELLTTTTTTTTTKAFQTTKNPKLAKITTKTTQTTTVSTTTEPASKSILDFLRVDSSDQEKHRLYVNYLHYPFYLLTALCAFMVVVFLIFYFIEYFNFMKRMHNENTTVHSMQLQSTSPAPHSKDKKFDIKINVKGFLLNLISLNPKLAFESSKSKNDSSKVENMPLTVTLCILVLAFTSSVYGCHKLQTNYLFPYSIQPEYESVEHHQFIYVETNTSETSVFSFTNSYKPMKLTLISAAYVLCSYYGGIIVGLVLNYILLKNPLFSIQSLTLLYVNSVLHFAMRLFTLLFVSIMIFNEAWPTFTELTLVNIAWYLITFLNGLFISSLLALIYEYINSVTASSALKSLDVVSKYVLVLELIGLSCGAALFQYMVSWLIDFNHSFNAFINVSLLTSIATLLLVSAIHVIISLLQRKPRTVNPN